MPDAAGITTELARGRFTDEMLEEMRSLIGTELRTDACANNEYATRLAILRFAEGIGDDNPLWTAPAYAAATPHRTLIAPPSFIFACLASVQVGWRGLGGFHADTTLKFHRTIGVGDRITARVFLDGFDGPKTGNFAGRRIKDYIRQEYHNQDDELVAEFVCSVGDEIDPVTKGPLGLTDEIAYIAAGAAPIPRVAARRVALRRYRRHPRWAYRDPRTCALEPVYSVHYNDYAARLQGAQAAYDVGIQRTCWQIHSLTNWMGDAGFLQAANSQYRSHVYLSDVVRLGGRVAAKEVDADGSHLVRLTTWARNQRGQDVMPGTAVIALPSRTVPGGAARTMETAR